MLARTLYSFGNVAWDYEFPWAKLPCLVESRLSASQQACWSPRWHPERPVD